MHRELVAVAVGVVALFGCMKTSEKYCAMHPEDTANCGGGDGGGTRCSSDPECSSANPELPVCEAETCVECTPEKAERCAALGHICEGTSCRRCGEHLECITGVCQADGTCAAAGDIAYVAQNGTGDCSSPQSACADLETAKETGKPIIKVSGMVRSNNSVTFDAGTTAIYGAPNASITHANSSGSIISVENTGTTLAIYDLRITGADSGDGISAPQGEPTLVLEDVVIDRNDGFGVRFPTGGNVTITRSVIARNNGGIGLLLSGVQFSVTNTIIALNGSPSQSVGGASLLPEGTSRFEFNTVAANSSSGFPNIRGILCNGVIPIRNSIVTGNHMNGCESAYSMVDTGPVMNDNIAGDPMFVSTTAEAIDPAFFRLMPASPAKDKADMAATLMMDIDHNARPVNNRSDMGADEVSP